jgi:hypothetical protein
MKRRSFLSAGCALGFTPVMGMPEFAGSLEQQAETGVQYFEWIRYRLHLGHKQNLVANYYRDTAIPAMNRLGIKNVGVFNVKHGPNAPTLHVIIPHPSMESIATLNDKLLDDKNVVQSGTRFLEAPLSDTACVGIEKSILRAFSHFPEIQVPLQKRTNSPRIFQVRTYESPSIAASKKKIHMFNEGGEIDVFKTTGLQPVLFGETIAGEKIPSLVYILAFDNMAALEKNWNVFRQDSRWETLKNNPYYADVVSCINDWIWTPTSFSQI